MVFSVEPSVAGRTILVVEDEYLIADDLAGLLRACGARVCGPVASVEQATARLDAGEWPEAAVLDINLREQRVYPLVDRLRAAGVPVVFTTGYDASQIPDCYADIPRCEKPVAAEAITRALADALTPAQATSAAVRSLLT